jgi:hypothetical protein
MSKRTIDMELEAADIAFVQNGDNGDVFIQTKDDDCIHLGRAIVDRIMECGSRRAA